MLFLFRVNKHVKNNIFIPLINPPFTCLYLQTVISTFYALADIPIRKFVNIHAPSYFIVIPKQLVI